MSDKTQWNFDNHRFDRETEIGYLKDRRKLLLERIGSDADEIQTTRTRRPYATNLKATDTRCKTS